MNWEIKQSVKIYVWINEKIPLLNQFEDYGILIWEVLENLWGLLRSMLKKIMQGGA